MTDTLEQIKMKYQQLIRENHPDKGVQETSDKFLKINEAWRTLKDTELRKQYDCLLIQNSLNGQLIHDEVNWNELKLDDSGATYNCRCGSNILIDKQLIADDDIVVECGECSNCIIVKMF